MIEIFHAVFIILKIPLPRVFWSSSPGATLYLGSFASMSVLITNIFFSFKSFFHGFLTIILTLYLMYPTCFCSQEFGRSFGISNSKSYSCNPASCSSLSSSSPPPEEKTYQKELFSFSKRKILKNI